MKRTLWISLILGVMMACAAGPAFAVEAEPGEPIITEVEPPVEEVQQNLKLPDQDQLLMDYMQHQVSEEASSIQASKAKKTRGSRLTGAEAVAYKILRAGIEDIAQGKQTSTKIEIPFSKLLGDKTAFTAAELGVDGILDEESYSITQEAKDALFSKVKIDQPALSALRQALLTDLPYDLYWFDKVTGGMGLSTGSYGYAVGEVDGEYTISFYDNDPKWTVRLFVSPDYSVTGAAGTTDIDSAKAGQATAAASNAADVIDANAAKKDLAKLTAYKDAICAATSYNHPVANNSNTPYGDPWQMIWVFDGDENTKVVCEGYAKAFQFLCDLSTFKSDEIESHIVDGVMSGGDVSGNHMWNIVHMNDKKNYLVDVTNCDEGSVGADDLLFLKGYKSITSGNTYVYNCNGTNITYEYNDKTLNLYDDSELAMTQVDYEEGIIDSGIYDNVLWRLTEDGELIIGKEGKTYTFANNSTRKASDYPWSAYAGAFNEEYQDYDEGFIKKVSFKGTVKGNGSCAGMFQRANGMKEIDMTGFNVAGVTDMSEMFADCDQLTYINLLGFDMTNVQNTDNMFRECISLKTIGLSDKCRFNSESANLPISGFTRHSTIGGEDVTSPPLENLSSFDSAYPGWYYADPCDGNHIFREVKRSAVSPTCTKAGKKVDQKCIRCDEVVEGETIEALGHDYHTDASTAVTPTCTKDGKEADQKCSRCDSVIEGDVIKALGHDWDEGVVTTEPGCETTGEKVFTCKRDHSHTKTETVEALGHQVQIIPGKAPTCTEFGQEDGARCIRCGNTLWTGKPIQPTGHDWSDWIKLDENQHQRICANDKSHVEKADHEWDSGKVTTEPTTEETGVRTYTCNDCHATRTEVIPAKDLDPITPSDTTAGKASVDASIPTVDTDQIETAGDFADGQMTINFPTDYAVSNYWIQYRQAGDTEWQSEWTAGSGSFSIPGLGKTSLCEFRIAPYVKTSDGTWTRGEWSTVSYRYMNTVKLKSAKAGKKRIKIAWVKDPGASGYQILYSMKKDMTDAQTITVGTAKTKYTIKKLKSKKKYFVRVMPFKKVLGNTYVGIPSNTKAKKVR